MKAWKVFDTVILFPSRLGAGINFVVLVVVVVVVDELDLGVVVVVGGAVVVVSSVVVVDIVELSASVVSAYRYCKRKKPIFLHQS